MPGSRNSSLTKESTSSISPSATRTGASPAPVNLVLLRISSAMPNAAKLASLVRRL